MELVLSIISVVSSLAALTVALLKRRKPTLAGSALRAVVYARGLPGSREDRIRHACHAVQREDAGDNGKRDWPDPRIRQEVEALFPKES